MILDLILLIIVVGVDSVGKFQLEDSAGRHPVEHCDYQDRQERLQVQIGSCWRGDCCSIEDCCSAK